MSIHREGDTERSKLRDIIRYIVKNYDDSSLTRTKLMKLLYIADREAKSSTGDKISETNYIRYYYGPYSEEAMNTVENLSQEEITEKKGRSSKGDFYIYEPTINTKEATSLTEEEKSILSDILSQYSGLDTESLVDRVYEEDDLHDVDKYTEIL